MPPRIYLDHAATTPLLPEAREAMAAALERWANPSSPHAEGRAARAALEEARGAIAAACDWTGEAILTSGASESLALALRGAVAERRLATAVEHDAVFRAVPEAERLTVDASGGVTAEELERQLAAPGRAIVAVQWANSETGVRQPIAALAEVVHGAGGLLLVDAAQMPAGADTAVVAHADFVAVSAHKRGGPPGVGALLVRDLATLRPSGGQERGYRPGTENLPGAAGFAAALGVAEPLAPYAVLRKRLDTAIVAAGGEVIAPDTLRYPAIGSYRMPGIPAAAQLVRFDLGGIAVSAGSACSSGSMRPSHVLAAMGMDPAAAGEVIRVSFGRATTAAEVDRFAAAWAGTAEGARARAA